MILEKAIVPDIKDGCPTKEDWEARRKLILNTLSEIEYGKRPAVDYAVTWKELLREEMERLAKQRKREKSYREKRKAKKIAENGGEIVKKKIRTQSMSSLWERIYPCKQPTDFLYKGVLQSSKTGQSKS